MRKASIEEQPLVLEIISTAFYDNKSVNYVIRQGDKENNLKRIRALINYGFKLCFQYGEIWLDEKNQGCLMFLDPSKKKFDAKSLLWDLQLALHSLDILRIGKILKREALIKKNHPQNPFLHLWFIGVLPEHQGTGLGTKVLGLIKEKAEADNLPIYLETSVEKNLGWYKMNGFSTYNSVDFDDHTLYMLKNE